MKDRLIKFYDQWKWLPGNLQWLLGQKWANDETLHEEVARCLIKIEDLPADGSLGARTRSEQAFLKEFRE